MAQRLLWFLSALLFAVFAALCFFGTYEVVDRYWQSASVDWSKRPVEMIEVAGAVSVTGNKNAFPAYYVLKGRKPGSIDPIGREFAIPNEAIGKEEVVALIGSTVEVRPVAEGDYGITRASEPIWLLALKAGDREVIGGDDMHAIYRAAISSQFWWLWLVPLAGILLLFFGWKCLTQVFARQTQTHQRAIP
jgi:hypothetical protein